MHPLGTAGDRDPGPVTVPEEWKSLPEAAAGAGTVLVVGAPDRGKSTLVRWLAGVLARERVVGWVDGDVGQPALGVPTLQSLALLREPPAALPWPVAAHFVGETTPRGHMLPLLVGLRRLRDLAADLGAEVVLVDTTGFVASQGGGGVLKRWKAELLEPGLIVALEWGGELGHFLDPMQGEGRWMIRRLAPPPAAQRRAAEDRARRRTQLFRRYFADADDLSLPATLPVLDPGRPTPGQLVALQDRDGLCLGLGVVVRSGALGYVVRTPRPSLDGVSGLRLGATRLDHSFAEDRAPPPGTGAP